MFSNDQRSKRVWLFWPSYLILLFAFCFKASAQDKPNAVISDTNNKVSVESTVDYRTLESVYIDSLVFVFASQALTLDEMILQKLQNAAKKYEKKHNTLIDLYKATQELTKLLVDNGYVNSGVRLPNQKVVNGKAALEIIPGRLAEIEVTGNKDLTVREIETYFSSVRLSPLNLKKLQQSIQQLNEDPLVKNVEARIEPTEKLGFASLVLDIQEASPHRITADLSNAISPNIGGEVLEVVYSNNNFWNVRDIFTAKLRIAEGLNGGSLGYVSSLGGSNNNLVLGYDYSESKIVGELESLDIKGESRRSSIGLQRISTSTATTELKFQGAIVIHENDTFLGGEPISFATIESERPKKSESINFSQEWSKRNRENIFAVYSNIEYGQLNDSDSEEDSQNYIAWQIQAQWLHRINFLRSRIKSRVKWALVDQSLPSFRKFTLGGQTTVRGYRENLFTRDNGVSASIEWQIPIKNDTRLGSFDIQPFVDVGHGWDNKDDDQSVGLSSIGVGVDWRLQNRLRLRLDYAYALAEPTINGNVDSQQDGGISFRLNFGL